MAKIDRKFVGFVIAFVLLYMATNIFEQMKGLGDWVLFIGILYLAYKILKK